MSRHNVTSSVTSTTCTISEEWDYQTDAEEINGYECLAGGWPYVRHDLSHDGASWLNMRTSQLFFQTFATVRPQSQSSLQTPHLLVILTPLSMWHRQLLTCEEWRPNSWAKIMSEGPPPHRRDYSYSSSTFSIRRNGQRINQHWK